MTTKAKPFCYVMCPVDLFRRPQVVRMLPKWPRAIEWLFFVLGVAREAQSRGRLVVDGEPVTRQTLEYLHRNPIDPTWIDYLVEIGWMVETDGVLELTRPTDWYRPRSREHDYEADRSQERRDQAKRQTEESEWAEEQRESLVQGSRPESDRSATASQPQSTVVRPQFDRTATVDDRTQSKLRQDNLREDKYPPSSFGGVGGLGEEEDEEAPGVASVADAPALQEVSPGGSPPRPPLLDGVGITTQLSDKVAALRRLGTLNAGERRSVAKFVSEASRCGTPAEVLRWAVDAAVEKTRAEKAGGRTVKCAVKWCLGVLYEQLECALATHEVNQRRAAAGLTADAVYTWRPPEDEA